MSFNKDTEEAIVEHERHERRASARVDEHAYSWALTGPEKQARTFWLPSGASIAQVLTPRYDEANRVFTVEVVTEYTPPRGA